MRTIIAGCRHIEYYGHLIRAVISCPWEITTVISGGARGVDALGEQFAKERALPLEIYAADWNKHGKAAGPIRNKHMASVAQALLALWDRKSRGTMNMIDEASKLGLKVYIHYVEAPDVVIEREKGRLF